MSNQKDPQRTVQFFPNAGQPIKAKKIGRNDKCPCGSGKKAKFCHGVVTRYYYSRQD